VRARAGERVCDARRRVGDRVGNERVDEAPVAVADNAAPAAATAVRRRGGAAVDRRRGGAAVPLGGGAAAAAAAAVAAVAATAATTASPVPTPVPTPPRRHRPLDQPPHMRFHRRPPVGRARGGRGDPPQAQRHWQGNGSPKVRRHGGADPPIPPAQRRADGEPEHL